MKNFKNYTVRQRLNYNGKPVTQWEKRYEDGQNAWLCVEDYKCTRALVEKAFEAQEKGFDFGGIFTKKHLLYI